MRKSLNLILLAGLLTGCAYFSDEDHGAPYGEGLQSGTTDVSTGADVGMGHGITGSEWAPPP